MHCAERKLCVRPGLEWEWKEPKQQVLQGIPKEQILKPRRAQTLHDSEEESYDDYDNDDDYDDDDDADTGALEQDSDDDDYDDDNGRERQNRSTK